MNSFGRSAGILLCSFCSLCCFSTSAQISSIDPAQVKADETFLASDALQGRGSATRDEQIAAVYIASQFEAFHLTPAPGMQGFLQQVKLTQEQMGGTGARHSNTTYNAIGFLPGLDQRAGTLLLTSHLDHLGIGKPVGGDAIYNGADDDASGTTAVLELARLFSAGPRFERSILFVCFGSEELGAYGSSWFAEHSPVSLDQLVANIEFEMIGMQDPRMPKGTLLLTGWERSNLGPALQDHGAKVGPDPYTEEHFFERSDNFPLAKKGVVAQTAAGYCHAAYYHQPDDDLDHLDLAFMTSAIQSMVEPLRWLANSSFRPEWRPGLKP